MIYIGIDPGLHGAVAVLTDDAEFVFDTPIMEVESNGKAKNKYHVAAMALLLEPHGRHNEHYRNSIVVLEAVHSLPKQGVASSFAFGEGLGIWKGIIAAYGLPLELVSPQRWKKEIMADQGKDKSAARHKAAQIFPQMAALLSRVKDDGRAEALLLAEYGRRIRKE